jgi:hypothetical protein
MIRRNIVIAVLFLFFAALVFSMRLLHECQIGVDVVPGFLKCMGPSEFGNFVAGAFSPLALIILVLTLYSQMESLTLTRTVAKVQIGEIRSQNELIRQQTTALTAQERRLKVESVLSDLALIMRLGVAERPFMAGREISPELLHPWPDKDGIPQNQELFFYQFASFLRSLPEGDYWLIGSSRELFEMTQIRTLAEAALRAVEHDEVLRAKLFWIGIEEIAERIPSRNMPLLL